MQPQSKLVQHSVAGNQPCAGSKWQKQIALWRLPRPRAPWAVLTFFFPQFRSQVFQHALLEQKHCATLVATSLPWHGSPAQISNKLLFVNLSPLCLVLLPVQVICSSMESLALEGWITTCFTSSSTSSASEATQYLFLRGWAFAGGASFVLTRSWFGSWPFHRGLGSWHFGTCRSLQQDLHGFFLIIFQSFFLVFVWQSSIVT